MSPRGLTLCLIVLTAVSAIVFSRPAAAEDGMVWQFHEGNDPDNHGAMTAHLVYGVPETDNVQVMGICDARPSTGAKFSSVTFGADIGDLANGADADLRFSGGGIEQTLHGNIERAEGEGLNGVHLDINNDDPIWTVLSEKDTLDYQVPGYRAATLNLTPGRDKLEAFVKACRTYEKAVLGEDEKADATEANGNAEKEAFDSAKELGTVAAFEAFLANYPTGFYADLARAYIVKLSKSDAASPAPPPPVKKDSEPEPKKEAATPKCSARSILIEGKCILKKNAAAYCGPGYRLQGHRCVHGAYVAPKKPLRSHHGCPPGQVWSPQELCHYDD